MYLKVCSRGGALAPARLTLALVLLVLVAGCGEAPSTGNGPAGTNSINAPATANTPSGANTASGANTSPTAPKPAELSPTETVKAYYEAGVRKDTAAVRKLLSRESLQMMEEVAKSRVKTLHQLISEAAEMDAGKPPPVLSNEKVMDRAATVDIEVSGKTPMTMPLIKEGGEWKLAFGKPKGGEDKR